MAWRQNVILYRFGILFVNYSVNVNLRYVNNYKLWHKKEKSGLLLIIYSPL